MKDKMQSKELLRGTIAQAKTQRSILILYNSLSLLYNFKLSQGDFGKGDNESITRSLQKAIDWIEDKGMEGSEVAAQLKSAEDMAAVLAFLKDILSKMPEASVN